MSETDILTRKDFASDQTVRWCPGCGDYAILSAVQKALPQLGRKKSDFVFISGIGCAARFPYYMDTYGFHTIHGRGPAIATGVKLANPELSVWEIQGDGDALAIGGNHFIHAMRRNIDINILMFNNEIYGLTKGQYSPTSPQGLKTKSTPYGSLELPFSAGELCIGSKGTFFARAVDKNPAQMTDIFIAAEKHHGTSMVEILQNCVIFNDQIHAQITNKETAADNQLHLKHGAPMIFGKENNKGLILDGAKLKVVKLGENGITESDILVHDVHETDPALQLMLVRMMPPEMPVALGVIRSVKAPSYNDQIHGQIKDAKANSKIRNMEDLLHSGQTYDITE